MSEDRFIFEKERGRLYKLAYAMIGERATAEDMVQEAWIKWNRAKQSEIREVSSYLTSIIVNLCLDELKSARVRRENYVGPWLPEPMVTSAGEKLSDNPEMQYELSMAVMVILEKLNPQERAIYVLNELFDYPFTKIGAMLGKNDSACRKAGQRAREKLEDADLSGIRKSRCSHEYVADFLQALREGESDRLMQMLLDDAIIYSDGGGKVTAARKPIVGSDRICRFLLGVVSGVPGSTDVRIVDVNGRPGFEVYMDGCRHSVWSFRIEGDKIREIYAVLNPEKLQMANQN